MFNNNWLFYEDSDDTDEENVRNLRVERRLARDSKSPLDLSEFA